MSWISPGQVTSNPGILQLARVVAESGEPISLHPSASRNLSSERAWISQILRSAEAYPVEEWHRGLWQEITVSLNLGEGTVVIRAKNPLDIGSRITHDTALQAIAKLMSTKEDFVDTKWITQGTDHDTESRQFVATALLNLWVADLVDSSVIQNRRFLSFRCHRVRSAAPRSSDPTETSSELELLNEVEINPDEDHRG